MPILIKGGVWKNSEDEILKAAVMKYGMNQWDRISSLLVRKTHAQCKARWYEWLDPAIKKTEWSREEDEKLLHLAKLFPSQWRTIAPIVGRTAHQCISRYESLLDSAQGKLDEGEDDPRLVRPGEVDPVPETRPARADPVDMDEDEKEMLLEARARLANVRGKKAKRKARERLLDATSREAEMQKNRELRAAGLSVSSKRLKSDEIDYSKEIPFEILPQQGAHSTASERVTTEIGIQDQSKAMIDYESQTRKNLEKRERQEDEKRVKRVKDRNLPEYLEKNAIFANTHLPTSFDLPPPQLSEAQISRALKSAPDAFSHIRTPLPNSETVKREAQNAISLKNLQGPLLGEENVEIVQTEITSLLPTKAVTPIPESVVSVDHQKNKNPSVTELLSKLSEPQRHNKFVQNPVSGPVSVVYPLRDESRREPTNAGSSKNESFVISQNLPRIPPLSNVANDSTPEAMVAREMNSILIKDAALFTIKGTRPYPVSAIPHEAQEILDLNKAQQLVTQINKTNDIAIIFEYWNNSGSKLKCINGSVRASDKLSDSELSQVFQKELEAINSLNEKSLKKAISTESKIDVLTAGHISMVNNLTDQINELLQRLSTQQIELKVAQSAQAQEVVSIQNRIYEWSNRADSEKRLNKELNNRYEKLAELKTKLLLH